MDLEMVFYRKPYWWINSIYIIVIVGKRNIFLFSLVNELMALTLMYVRLFLVSTFCLCYYKCHVWHEYIGIVHRTILDGPYFRNQRDWEREREREREREFLFESLFIFAHFGTKLYFDFVCRADIFSVYREKKHYLCCHTSTMYT